MTEPFMYTYIAHLNIHVHAGVCRHAEKEQLSEKFLWHVILWNSAAG